jgi:hypothetical protein
MCISRQPTPLSRFTARKGKELGIYVDYLFCDSTENAQRFANALKHAVGLCGGMKSSF